MLSVPLAMIRARPDAGKGGTMSIAQDVEAKPMSHEEAHELLDRQARRYLGMSADEFIAAWSAGEFASNPDRPEVMRVAALLPFGR